jgi:hypothetical protein
LIDAVLVTVERKDATIGHSTGRFDRGDDDVGGQSIVRVRIGYFLNRSHLRSVA